MTALGLGWRVHSSSGVVVAVTGPAAAPVIVHREEVSLFEGEPYHAAAALPREDAPAFLASVESAATDAAAAAIRGLSSSLGPVAAVGVVGGDRKLPELSRILTKHALLHAAERDLFAQAIVAGATRQRLPVTTVPATGQLFDRASEVLGVALAPTLAALGKSIGPPWHKDYREATAAALVALDAATRSPV